MPRGQVSGWIVLLVSCATDFVWARLPAEGLPAKPTLLVWLPGPPWVEAGGSRQDSSPNRARKQPGQGCRGGCGSGEAW